MMDSQSYNSVTHNLTVEQKEYAAKVLNETDENRESAVAEIKRWIQENDLRARTDDIFILQFLRTCKFNIENTKKRLQNFQKMRANRPEWYANRDPMQSKLQELLDCGAFIPLRKLDDQGRMVIIGRVSYDPHKFTVVEVFQVVTMILDVALRDSVKASLHGCVIIGDMGDTTLRHVTQMGPRILMHILNALTNCFPLRIKSLNFINTPKIANITMILVRYFLNNKMKKRLHVYSHKTTPDYFKNVPANILPAEYGGTDGTIQELAAHWKKVIIENRDWFIDDEKYKPVL